MIRYALTCDQDHQFDSWFQSAAAWDRLSAAGHLACAICGSTKVTKALMAPTLRADANSAALSEPRNAAETALAELRAKIESESHYVGLSFAAQARAMHEGNLPERAIHGEARPDEARALLEEGVPIAPLPFRPRARTH